MNSRIKLISLTANQELAKSIAKILGINVCQSEVIHFADGEILFQALESVRGCDVYIIQSTCNPVTERLMEVLLTIDACKRASARSIACVIPYFGYARQDRKAKPRQPISAKLVADLLTTAGANRILCTDLHSAQIAGFFNIPFDDASAMPLFLKYFYDLYLDNAVCVSPDHGGLVRTSKLAEKLNLPIAVIDKRRPEPNKAEVIGIVGDIKGKNCIIIDDIVDTAGTLCAAANKLVELGAKSVYAAISHGVLSRDAVAKIDASAITKLIITDSIPLAPEKQSKKIEVLSLAPMIANVIKALDEGTPLSDAHINFIKKLGVAN